MQEILSHVDHTLLSRSATWEQIKTVCDDGIKFSVASVCIPPCFVAQASKYVAGKVKICTVIGFPNGYNTAAVKCFEAAEAVKNGADEIDTVINPCMVKMREYDKIENEIKQIKDVCGKKILKVIIETCLLNDEEKIALCGVVSRAGADFIKTSTGFAGGGATLEDVALLKKHVVPTVLVKAAGGIRSLDDARAFLKAGASRLGTSAIVNLAKEQMK